MSLDEYAVLKPNNTGAPMPAEVSEHIADVREQFPAADVRLYAHPSDDPFVEFEIDGEKVMTMAWRRYPGHKYELFPAI